MKTNIVGITVRCHDINGPYWLAVNRKSDIDTLDSCNQLTRIDNKQLWYKLPNEKKFDMFGKYKDMPCFIIGKGPSLDFITAGIFKSNYPILCCNDSCHKIESLNLLNPIYTIITDKKFKDKDSMIPRILNISCVNNYKEYYQWCTAAFLGSLGFQHVGHMATIIAKTMGCNKIYYIGFEGAFGGNASYAKIIGYKETKRGPASRFSKHGKHLIEAAGNIPYQLITLTRDHSLTFDDIQQQQPHNLPMQYDDLSFGSLTENKDTIDLL